MTHKRLAHDPLVWETLDYAYNIEYHAIADFSPPNQSKLLLKDVYNGIVFTKTEHFTFTLHFVCNFYYFFCT